MKTFITSEIETFLKAVDRHLPSPFEIIVIGGAAAALAYKVIDYTKDIDTFGGRSLEPIMEACKKASKETGLTIPIAPAAVADGPYHFEDRLVKVKISGLQKLSVCVPEVHDLTLMKCMRANDNDRETVKQLKENHGLNLDLLIKRFKEEMTHVVGNKSSIRLNFLATVETAFGDAAAEKMEKLIPKDWAK